MATTIEPRQATEQVWHQLARGLFAGTAIVHPAGSAEAGTLAKELGSLLPAERQASACIIEITPEGAFVTYGVGVPLLRMRTPAAARARVPVALARDG